MTKPRTRLFVQDQFQSGQSLDLAGEQAHFLGNVLRLKEGDRVNVFNESAGEWSAEIRSIGKRNCSLRLLEQYRPPTLEKGPWLAFAPLKKTRTDFVVEKSTELGVERLLPVFTKFTASDRVNTDRLRMTAIEAAEQCRRLSIPMVDKPQKLTDLLKIWPDDRTLIVGDETGDGVPLARLLDGISGDYGFLVGPEGGFSKEELNTFRTHSKCKMMDLGARILRAETAAIAALSISHALTAW